MALWPVTALSPPLYYKHAQARHRRPRVINLNETILMKKLEMFVGCALVALLGLTGCGGVEAAELTSESTVSTME